MTGLIWYPRSYNKEEQIKLVEIDNDRVIFNDKIHIPIEPMIGVIGGA